MIVVAGQHYGSTLSTDEAAELCNCSPQLLQRERGNGRLPVEPLELGKRLRWPTVRVAEALGLPYEVLGPAVADTERA